MGQNDGGQLFSGFFKKIFNFFIIHMCIQCLGRFLFSGFVKVQWKSVHLPLIELYRQIKMTNNLIWNCN
jgi:hypothetical protein